MPEYRNATASLKENTAYVNEILPVQESFDIVQRNMMIGGREAAFFFVDGFTKDESMLKIMDSMMSITEEDMPKSATAFSKSHIPYVEVDILVGFDQIFHNILSGTTALFIDGYEGCFIIDCRTYPARSVDEPDKDKALRGSRDGFVETIVFNTALMRRKNPGSTSDHENDAGGRKYGDRCGSLLYGGSSRSGTVEETIA